MTGGEAEIDQGTGDERLVDGTGIVFNEDEALGVVQVVTDSVN